MTAILRWEPPLYAPQERIVDTAEGRYHVKRSAPSSRSWVVKLNGQIHSGLYPSAKHAMAAIERELITKS